MNITPESIVTSIVILSVISVFIAIIVDFIYFNKRSDTKREKKSIVTTGTMVMYYFLYYLVIRIGFGKIQIQNKSCGWFFLVAGTVFVVMGAFVNIWGRFQLKSNWANQIKIYDDHSLVTTGAFAIVRHPLYASIMLMLLGGSMVYGNYASAIMTFVIFIPFMYHRAKQEEFILRQQFENYSEYMRKTGMFFPKFWGRS